jgi:hypothetical protein
LLALRLDEADFDFAALLDVRLLDALATLRFEWRDDAFDARDRLAFDEAFA